MDNIVKEAFIDEFEKIAEQEKEALFGVKTLLMGAKRLGSGIAGKAKAGLIKARVGAQKAQLGVTKAIQNVAAKPSRGTGGKFQSPGAVKKFFRRTTKDTSKLEASIAAGTAKAKQTSQIAGAKIRGTGTAIKRNYNVEKQDTKAFIDNIARKRRIKRKARVAGDQRIIDRANANAPKPIDTKPKIDTSAPPKPKVDKPKVKKTKQQPILDTIGASLVGNKSKNKTLVGGAALVGGGVMASNMIGGKKQKPAEQGIFFKSSSLNKTASLGGVTLGSITKEANPKMKAVKMIGGGAAAGAAGMAAMDELTEKNPEQKMYDQGLKSFKATFPELEEPQAEQMFKQVYQQYKKNQDIQLSKSIIQGASEAQKFGSFVHGFSTELSKEANIAAVGKLVSRLGYGIGRAVAGGKHLGKLNKTKKLTNMQQIGKSMMKNRKMVGATTVAGGAGYMLGGRKKD